MKRITSLLLFTLLFFLLPANAGLVCAADIQPQAGPSEVQGSGGGTGLNIQPPPPMMNQDTLLGSEGSDAISRALKNAIATQPDVPASTGVLGNSIVTQEIGYELPDAREVFLVWWVDGWHILPEGKRPPETVVKNGAMVTPMIRRGDTFTARVEVPIGTYINYCFQITKTSKNSAVDIWDVNGYPPRNYQTIGRPGRTAVVLATLDLEKAQAESNRTYAPFVTQEVRYHTRRVEGVSLVWGINGWQTIPDDVRPLGTTIQDKLMHTPMAQTGDIFVAKVQVPLGAIIDFAFLITKTNDGANIKIWDRADDFRRIATTNGVIDIDPKARVAQDAVQSEPRGNISESSVLMQGFRNHKVFWLILAFLAFGISVLISLKLRKTI
jgi:hypothetical protein